MAVECFTVWFWWGGNNELRLLSFCDFYALRCRSSADLAVVGPYCTRITAQQQYNIVIVS